MTFPIKRGAVGRDVLELQELLNLHGFAIEIDHRFGAATQSALASFQTFAGLTGSQRGVLDEATWSALTEPMRKVQRPHPLAAQADTSFGEAVVLYAYQHLEQRPRELGTNQGPWVRLYCHGHDGTAWFWCAGFAHFVVWQAWNDFRIVLPNMPIEDRFPEFTSVDRLALHASTRDRLVMSDTIRDAPEKYISPGDLFLVRGRMPNDWKHVGIVTTVSRETIGTIEGNTTAQGGRNGDRVRDRTRAIDGLDFIVMPRITKRGSVQTIMGVA